MKSLRQTQAEFCDALNQVHVSSGRNHPVEKLISGTNNLSAKQRLDIYRSTSLSTQVNALRQIYPVCEKIVGLRMFKQLARDYVANYPSQEPDLNCYGESFPSFIVSLQIESLAGFEYLTDLCQLEWLLHAAYYAEDDQSFDFLALENAWQEGVDFSLAISRSLTLMKTNYPIYTIWQQHHKKLDLQTVNALETEEYLCIFRHEFSPSVERINLTVYDFLQACSKGMSLPLLAADPALCEEVEKLSEYIARGWISGFVCEA